MASSHFLLLSLALLLIHLSFVANFTSASLEEANALLKWKATLKIPNNSKILSSWTPLSTNTSASASCPTWFGIACNAYGNINMLNLSTSELKVSTRDWLVGSKTGSWRLKKNLHKYDTFKTTRTLVFAAADSMKVKSSWLQVLEPKSSCFFATLADQFQGLNHFTHEGSNGKVNNGFSDHKGLSSEHVSDDVIYILENGEDCLVYAGGYVDPNITQKLFGVSSFSEIPSQLVLKQYENPLSKKLNEVVNEIRSQRCNYLRLKLYKNGEPSGEFYNIHLVVLSSYENCKI
ncbi:von Willebrand factor, type A [Artemisia annua]|uniref:von Willebrand factor, type A n=1 Tax=Artemisia annua TaxID=35608 RepID=A0A2U1KZ94_ARTAN|nr:von Willebrand factor, type A [Artemisia annua]